MKNLKLLKDFDVKKYWNERLRDHPSLEGVGCSGLGERFNYWLYKAKLRTMKRVKRKYKLSFHGLKILDVGCGIGFWVEFYLSEGAKEIYAIDISDHAIQVCAEKYEKYNKVKVKRMDFGSSFPPKWTEKFDVVNCFDVAYHVVNDDDFSTFLNNACKAVKPGGHLLLNDLFIAYHDALHINFRELNHYEANIRRNKMRILDLIPMYFILNPTNRVHNKRIGHLLENIASTTAFLSKTHFGSLICPLIYVIDSLFTLANIKLNAILMVGIKRL
jgi:2-polyprenyl-3-methyl-5-hydroxy-6-metoxy-1,4-benzoquinol methylase